MTAPKPGDMCRCGENYSKGSALRLPVLRICCAAVGGFASLLSFLPFAFGQVPPGALPVVSADPAISLAGTTGIVDPRLGGVFAPAPAHSVKPVTFSLVGGVYVAVQREQTSSRQPSHRTNAPDTVFQDLNRFVFSVNNKADKFLIKPIAKGYRKVTHKKMRKALRNFLHHIDTPVVLLNDLLQFEFQRAAETSGRFMINSLIGFGGVADPAGKLGIPYHNEDFGQTLAVWGAPSGPYVVLPFLGPSTVRDALGLGVEGFFFHPINYIRTGAAQKARTIRTPSSIIAFREPLIEPLEDIERNSLDYYASFRSFYLQNRRNEILNGRSNIEDLPNLEYDDEGDDDPFAAFDDLDDFDDADRANSQTQSQNTQEETETP